MMEELKIETKYGSSIELSTWDSDKEMAISMYDDGAYVWDICITLDQATQLRDWLSEMIEKTNLK